MNISVARMRPTAQALRGCQIQLTRIADALETFLQYAYDHRTVAAKPDTSGEEPEIFYTSDEEDFKREYLEKIGKLEKEVEPE